MSEPADERLDEIDEAILRQLRATHADVDPPPADLVERVLFSIALENIDVEVAKLQDDLLVGSGARSTERARTITFDSESLTIMVSVTADSDDTARVDGWLAPPAALRVDLRVKPAATEESSSYVVTADETGRFVFQEVPHGLAQLVVQVPVNGGAETAKIVATPSLVL